MGIDRGPPAAPGCGQQQQREWRSIITGTLDEFPKRFAGEGTQRSRYNGPEYQPAQHDPRRIGQQRNAQQDIYTANDGHEVIGHIVTDAEDGEIVAPNSFGDNAECAMSDEAHRRSHAQGIMYFLCGLCKPSGRKILGHKCLGISRCHAGGTGECRCP